MHKIPMSEYPSLHAHFLPERPGPLVGMHVINTGNGEVWVDHWPYPRALLANAAENITLTGYADAVTASDLQSLISAGLIDASPQFEPIIREAFPELILWDRTVYVLEKGLPVHPAREDAVIRPLLSGDNPYIKNLTPEAQWIWKTWGTIENFAASGLAWGAFVGERLVSVACTFFVGDKHEDIGVVTELAFRRQGLSAACVAPLCRDIQKRGKIPSWTTTPSNIGSLRVAEKVGFKQVREDVLYVVGMGIPEDK